MKETTQNVFHDEQGEPAFSLALCMAFKMQTLIKIMNFKRIKLAGVFEAIAKETGENFL